MTDTTPSGPDLTVNLAYAYRELAKFKVTTRRAPHILERARTLGRVDGQGECGELPYVVTFDAVNGYVVTERVTRLYAVDVVRGEGITFELEATDADDAAARFLMDGDETGARELDMSVIGVRLADQGESVSCERCGGPLVAGEGDGNECGPCSDPTPVADALILVNQAQAMRGPGAARIELNRLRELADAVRSHGIGAELAARRTP
jgi:hypothetical protein